MKIAIPVTNGRLASHFGRCEEIAMIDADAGTRKIIRVEMLTPPPHEPGVLARWLHEQGVDVVIAGGMGCRAEQRLAQVGVTVVIGAPNLAAEEVVLFYLNGTLQTGANICDH